MSLHKFGIYLFAWKSSIAYFYSAVYSLSFGTFCPKGIKSAPCLKMRNLYNFTNGKQFGCGHTPKFLLGRGPAKMLVGEPPQTRLFGTKCPKEIGCVTAAIASVPYLCARP